MDVRGSTLLVDPRKQGLENAYAHLREGALERLLKAQELLPGDLRLLSVEGCRPPSLQREYLRSTPTSSAPPTPTGPPTDCTSPPAATSPRPTSPPTAPAPPSTSLADTDGRELDLGTRVNADPEESGGARYTHAPGISPCARAHHELLGSVLTAVGLVDYPAEWWHWPYGDRYWALATATPPPPTAPSPIAAPHPV